MERPTCGAWCMVCGVWCVVYGVWCKVSAVHDAQCMMERPTRVKRGSMNLLKCSGADSPSTFST
jgi:hypothetical protein